MAEEPIKTIVFSAEQSTIAKKRIYNFSHSINVRTIITPRASLC
jgi:hypothetical protein